MESVPKRAIIPRPVIIGVIVLLALCLAAGTVFYSSVEGLSLVDALYFSSMTLTTVGYGDFVPHTVAGKIFTSAFAFMGIGIFLGSATILFQIAIARMHKIHKEFKDNHSK